MASHLTAGGALSAPSLPARIGRGISVLLGWIVDNFEYLAIAVLLVAVLFPATPPTAGAIAAGANNGFWNGRIAGANIFEILVVGLAAIWMVRSLVIRSYGSSFDRWLTIGALIVVAGQAIAIPINFSTADFFPLDLERVLVPVAAYLLVTRSIRSERAMHNFALAVGTIITLRTIELVLVYGVTGKTDFGTITGRDALLITEDTLIILFPLVLAWGAMLDGRLSIWPIIGTLTLLGFIVTINMLSLRRGALIFIGGALIARMIETGWRRILMGAAAALVLFALLVAAGPARSILPDIKYAAKSAVLQTGDDSTSQRTSEIRSFSRNMDAQSWVTGRGLGVTWEAVEPAPVDLLSYGSGESALVRIGWHVYGLDWLYKLGLVGLFVIILLGWKLGRMSFEACRNARPRLRSAAYSYAVCIPFFALLAFTNLRVGLMTGITIGLLSKAVDFARKDQTMTSPTRSTEEA